MFHKPPSKLEVLQEAVADTLHGTLDHLPDKVKDVGSSVGETVAHGWEVAAHKASDALQAAGEALQAATSAASSVAGTTGATVSDAAGSALGTAGAVADKVRESVAQRKQAASKTAAREVAATKAGIKSAKAGVETAKAGAKKAAAKKADQAQRNMHLPEAVVYDTTSKWLWLAVGLFAGTIFGLLLAPTTGRRSRALLKDKVSKVGHGVADLGGAAAGKASDLGNRAAGVVHKVKASREEDTADDITIADRVRTELGRNPATHNLERLNIDSFEGVVTVRGPIADTELQTTLESIVRGVKGVVDVRLDLLIEDAPEDSATFVG